MSINFHPCFDRLIHFYRFDLFFFVKKIHFYFEMNFKNEDQKKFYFDVQNL